MRRHSRKAAPFLLLALALGLSAADGSARADPLLLDVVVNGRPVGKLGEFQNRGGALWATRHELDELGLQPGAGNPDELVALDALPGVSVRLDSGRQIADITAKFDALNPTVLGGPVLPRAELPVESGWGGVLDYDVAGTLAGGRGGAQAVLDGRVFSPYGVASTGAIVTGGAGFNRATRLDTTYTYSDPETLQRVRVGDVISSGLAWTRPLRLGGGQIARDFGLRPDLVTIPVPSIAGQVAVPSSVDVLVNGTQILSGAAEPGPFEIRQLPVVNGVNDIAVVVRDALGQPVTRTVPLYSSTALLAPGLDAYSLEGGAVRLGFGVRSDDYRAPALSGSYRRGLTDWLTASAHAEGTSVLGMGGIGAAAALGSVAVASVAVAGSSARGRSGMLAYGAAERISRTLSVSVAAQWTDGRFTDLASLYGDPVPNSAIRGSVGYAFGQWGTAAVAYTRQRRSAVARPGPFGATINGYSGLLPNGTLSGPAFYLPIRTSLLTASYSVPLGWGRATMFATAYHDFDNRSSSGALFGISMPLGERNSIAVGAGQSDGAASTSFQASRSVVAVGDAGGQLYATTGQGSRVLANGQYKSPWSLLEASAYHARGGTAWRGSATGALAVAGGDWFAANAIADSFAVVDTDGRAGVDVLYENRPVQRTGSSGRVLVPDLRSFEVNQLSIDANAMPLDVETGPTSRLVRPADRSGVVVHFPLRVNRAVLVRLVDEAGKPVPVGSTVRLGADGPAAPVGLDGEAYLRDIPPHAELVVTMTGRGTCRAAFDYHAVPGDLPVVDKLRCVAAP